MLKAISEIYAYREMIRGLVVRDLRGRYKKSALGFLWTFINPLLQLGVYTLVFSVILTNRIEKFYLFLFVALVPWMFFSSCLTSGAQSVIGSANMIKKIYFPKEVLPISYTTSCFVNMLFGFVIIFIVLILGGQPITWSYLFLPLVMLIEYMLCLGITLLVSALTVYVRDLEHILGIVSMLWFYVTPIVYSVEAVPEQFRYIMALNPMYQIIRAYRDILYFSIVPQIRTLIWCFAAALIVLVIGAFVFRSLKDHFVEEL